MDILEIKNVAYSYANSKEKVLSGVNQKFELGKFYAIVGKSGAGKSTLLSLLAGLDKPQTGQILFKNEDIQKKGYKKVSFVCHSTGGLLAASYIAESIHKNEQNKIDKVVTLGSPLYGTFVSHQALELGENDMFAELGIPDIALPYIYDWAKKTIRNMPCSYQLLPSNEFLSKNKSYLT